MSRASVHSRQLAAAGAVVACLAAAAFCAAPAGAYVATGDSRWVWHDPLPQGNTLYAVDSVSATTAFAVGSAGTVLKTSNGGVSWVASHPHVTAHLHAVDFRSPSLGFAVGDHGVALKTTDGGQHWQRLSTGTTANLCGVSFVSAARGWAAGSGGTILRTRDGGAHWLRQTSHTGELLNAVEFADTSHGWAVGDGYTILHTTDGGTHWHVQDVGDYSDLDLTALAVASKTTAWATGVYRDDSAILGTSDAGAHWHAQAGGDYYGIAALDPQHAWAVGAGGAIIRTTNGTAGAPAVTSSTTLLSGVSADAGGSCWAVGDDGVIEQSSDYGAHWTLPLYSTTIADDWVGDIAVQGSQLWAAGGNGVYHSTDSGVTWTSQSIPAPGTAGSGRSPW